MKVPKRFKLFGATVDVVDNPKLQWERGWSGSASYEAGSGRAHDL